MEFAGDSSWLGTALKVFYVDLLLGVDNALLIAMVCRSLPGQQRRDALLAGIAGAVAIRAILSLAVGVLLWIPYLRVVSGFILIVVALAISSGTPTYEETPSEPDNGAPMRPPNSAQQRSFGSTVGLVILADAIMSLDNVVAIGAISGGKISVVLAGLLLSAPIVMYGGWLLSKLVEQLKIVIVLGGAIAGWVAGELIMSEPAVSSWASTQAPALFLVVPCVVALFVLVDSEIAREWIARPRSAQARGGS